MTDSLLLNISSNTDNIVLSPLNLPDHFYRIFHYHITADRPVTVTFKSTEGTVKDICYGTNVTGGGIVVSVPDGVFDLPVGEGLNVNISVIANVGGVIKYDLIRIKE